MPPKGGFEAVKYKRNLPTRGPGAYAILGGVTAICAYGFYRVGKGNLEQQCVYPPKWTVLSPGQLDEERVIVPPRRTQGYDPPLDPAARFSSPYQFYHLWFDRMGSLS